MTEKHYPYPERLGDLAWLTAQRENARLRLIDGRARRDYLAGHIPGAQNVDFAELHTENTDPEGVADWQGQQLAALRAAGVNNDSVVVVYDEASLSNAGRGVWVLEYFGHDDVHLLDGGLAAWVAAGEALETGRPGIAPGDFTPHFRADLLATYRDILDRLDDPNVVIVDTRRRTEYLGTEVRARHSGTIPGAIHLEWTNNLDAQHEIADAEAVRARYEQQGITPDKEIIPFCGGGYRSAHTYTTLKMLGYPNVRNYLGSWGEWGNRDDVPIIVPES